MNLDRRAILQIVGSVIAALTAGRFARSDSSSEAYSDIAGMDKWVRESMEKMREQQSKELGSVVNTLKLGRFADPMYFLTDQIGWVPERGQRGTEVSVPTGFVTDFASIPRVFWTVLPPDGLYTYAAIIHDYLYWEQPVEREDADLTLRYVMEEFHVSEVTREAIYKGVRLGGGGPWKQNAALKRSGEKRVLKVFPTDPTVRWNDWKQRPDVFS